MIPYESAIENASWCQRCSNPSFDDATNNVNQSIRNILMDRVTKVMDSHLLNCVPLHNINKIANFSRLHMFHFLRVLLRSDHFWNVFHCKNYGSEFLILIFWPSKNVWKGFVLLKAFLELINWLMCKVFKRHVW